MGTVPRFCGAADDNYVSFVAVEPGNGGRAHGSTVS
jgi:hypothetical protein